MRKGKRYKQTSEINVVPYIDVMLVLLVIFMVTTPLLSQGVKVDLPTAAAKTIDAKPPEPIVVSIDAHGNYFLNLAANPNKVITAAELSRLVSSELDEAKGKNKRQVLIKGDHSVDYGRVVQAMVLLQHAGAETVGLVTQPDEKIKS